MTDGQRISVDPGSFLKLLEFEFFYINHSYITNNSSSTKQSARHNTSTILMSDYPTKTNSLNVRADIEPENKTRQWIKPSIAS